VELNTSPLRLFADSTSVLEAKPWVEQLGAKLTVIMDRRRELPAAMASTAWGLWFDQDGLGLQVNENHCPHR